MGNIRTRALEEFTTHKAQRFYEENRPVSEYFGTNVFDMPKMQRYLSAEAYNADAPDKILVTASGAYLSAMK